MGKKISIEKIRKFVYDNKMKRLRKGNKYGRGRYWN